MTILQALSGYYDRMAARGEAEPPGFSRENISYAIELTADGEPVAVRDLRQQSGRKLVPQRLSVPAAVKRTVGILPNVFWDKTAYVLGRTAGEGKRTAQEHAAFKLAHLDMIAGSEDAGLAALRRFLDAWTPERFDAPPFTADMLDANVVFQVQGSREYVHQRPAARALLAARLVREAGTTACLVTGQRAPAQRLHPTIKGVNGAQSSGAALVSFNLDAFTSYGKEQGENAPTSEDAAFRYGTALNALLDRRGANRLKRGIGDSTVVFWADASEAALEEDAKAAEDFFAQAVEPISDGNEAVNIRDALLHVAQGKPVDGLDPKLHGRTRFYILGLSPNAARLSVRFWMSDDFQQFAERLGRHYELLRIEPTPVGWTLPSVNLLLARTTALLGKFENIPDLLAGEVTRAILTGSPYPRTLLSATIQRLRAGDSPRLGWHAAVIKACLNRHSGEEDLTVALNPESKSAAYQLGRLFALMEAAQFAALGQVNAPIGDRYYGAASATPARVFPALLRGLKVHVADARKRGRGGWIEPKAAEIISHLDENLPRTLRLEDQGRFAVGYYHERGQARAKAEATAQDQQGGETGE
ncbi:MAG: type I-C CRISPR-associated protein Cas8c/Csd1 [Rhizobiales bacterium]|nr:type I-C CRISPR-associated protein Cas8c/Csd1 [Hyphomicrobiales bacterium]